MDAPRFPKNMTRANGDRRAQDRTYDENDALIIRDGEPPLPATLLDLSVEGARIRLGEPIGLPDRFDLYLTESGRARKAQLLRQDENELGLRFLDV